MTTEASDLATAGIPEGQIFVIGDSHIGLGDGDESPIVRWIDRLAKTRPRALYLDGDVFHYFIGDEKFITSSVTKFFARLRELRDSGVEVHYIEGNRDFFLDGSIAEESVSSFGTSAAIEAGGRRFFVIHGDMINDADYLYFFWRLLSKNPLTRFSVSLLPKPVARWFVDQMEKKLAMTNFKHRQRLPIEQMEAYGRKMYSEGYGMVIFGHFHKKTTVEAGEATVTVLPAWFESGEAFMISPETGESSFVTV